ncbi:MAG TPA: amino acid ABC transporter permease [Anaerolineae bacterium]|nr:amino acid ABC transporter permease [Anaerolineae bacterium]HNU04309.1 amino acid ABC transporter permease [Anaerolineae bacterium]
MTTAAETFMAPPARPGPRRWLKKNLFSSWFNTLLTVVAVAFIGIVALSLGRWALVTADWSPVVENLRLYAVGPYPAEQMWRVWAIVIMVSFLMGVSGGRWGGAVRTFALALAIAYGVLATVPISLEYLPLASRLRLASNILAVGLGILVGRRLAIKGYQMALAWMVSFLLTLLLLGGLRNAAVAPYLPFVESGRWGGLLLTFLLAIVGIVASFPIGVLLALGRQNSLPVVKALCVVFIEAVRGVPLVTLLFMTSILLPLFLPPEVRIDRVLRAMLGMTLFAAAYMAENVRGGLQAVPSGQVEAAKAMGLNGWQTMLLIVLPQALRVVIPAIVGQFIALFMDTTLAVVVGLLELLAIGRAIINSNPQWLLLDKEVFSFIALIFWIFTFSMAYASRRVEAAVGLGKR